jgi:glycine/D-amino acid oxidase-like deaminating enzyme
MCLNASRVLVATNGFASSLIGLDVKPARAQVLITEPIKNLPFKGVFHMDSGYYYFRNVGDRVLFGGGRNLDFEAEFTTEMSCSARIQEELDRILNEVILPGRKAKIAHRWAGIMGLGDTRKPIVKEVSRNLFCAVRLGGMGVALGSLVGEKAAMQIHESL